MRLINVDSTIHDQHVDQDVLSAAKAAKILGVKRETLYAYVSRGQLTRIQMGKGRAHGYLRADVERLKARSAARAGHGAVAAGALRWGEPVLDSAITLIDPARGPIYRGIAAVDLAEAGRPFEEVANHLWQSSRPWETVRVRGWTAPTLYAFASRIVSFGLGDPTRLGASRDTDLARGRDLILGLAGAKGTSSVAAAFLQHAKRKNERARRALDAALVLVADHELNASTFAARIAASAGADLYACVTAAIATLSGPRHGGESDRLEALVRDVGAPKRAKEVVLARTQRGDLLPGFGHPLYPKGDPRAKPLLSLARKLSRNPTLDAIIDVVGKTLGLAPTIDAGLVAISHAIGMPEGSASAIFALGRCAGWVAHALEQREAGYLLRPRARYIGP
jgi:citrate synthase